MVSDSSYSFVTLEESARIKLYKVINPTKQWVLLTLFDSDIVRQE